MSKEDLIDALDSVTWYNGLAEPILLWKTEGYLKDDGFLLSWDWDKFNSFSKEDRAQIQVIWMICVELFGDCGTSPRTGWIEKKNREEFFRFIDDITATYRDSDRFEE